MSDPINQEHLEAAQLQANSVRHAFMSSLSEEELAKFRAVEQAVDILVKNNIMFYLFPYLPSSKNQNKSEVWQWNSFWALARFDEKGKPDKETDDLNAAYHDSFLSSLVVQFGKGNSAVEAYNNFCGLVSYALGQKAKEL